MRQNTKTPQKIIFDIKPQKYGKLEWIIEIYEFIVNTPEIMKYCQFDHYSIDAIRTIVLIASIK